VTPLGWPHDLLSVDEFDEWPKVGKSRFELQDGVLYVTPHLGDAHDQAVDRLTSELAAQLPPGFEAVQRRTVVTWTPFPPSVREPDIVVVPEGSPSRVRPDRVALAVEVAATGSRAVDTLAKPFDYARAGIGHYWVVDRSLTEYRLGDDGSYQKAPAAAGTFTTTVPFPFTMDLTGLPATEEGESD
jgi:Uma2 family endonuclease